MIAAVAVLVMPAPAAARPGPPLTEPAAALASAVTCPVDPAAGAETPVLLVHGTLTDETWWDPSYARALPRDGHAACTVRVPDHQTRDLQRSVEYVVAAIRDVAARARRKVAVVSHSQGALLASFALRFWPDLAEEVDDMVGLAGVYEAGTELGRVICAVPCAPAGWQLTSGSRLLRAYTSHRLLRGPSYTSISTAYDELLVPQPRASHLDGAANIVLQDVCPGRLVEHGAISLDATVYALVLDALRHEGPADPGRLGARPCARTYAPGVGPDGLPREAVTTIPGFLALAANAVPAEPPVRCAFDQRCAPRSLTPVLHIARPRRTARSVTVSGRVELPVGATHQCEGVATVRVGRVAKTVPVASDCRFAVRLRLRGRPTRVWAAYRDPWLAGVRRSVVLPHRTPIRTRG